MDRKGIELPFGSIISGFFLLAVVVLIYLLFFAKVQDVHVIVVGAEAEIHAINLAQVLLSSDIVYSDGYTLHRGIFDKSKLDTQLKNLEIWYPDSIAVVGIKDEETGDQWSVVLAPKTVGGTAIEDLLNCLKNTIKIDISMIFRIPSLSPWEWPDLPKCFQESLVNPIVPYTRDFPVAIRVSDSEIHRGRMIVSLRELIF